MEGYFLISWQGLPNVDQLGDAKDLAQKLGEAGINKLLEVVCCAYQSLRNNNLITAGMSEDEITEELAIQVDVICRQSSMPINIASIPQKIDRKLAKQKGKSPAIDFCFRHTWVKDAYFGFECKILAEANTTLSKEYIKEGVCRYLDGKYCSKGSASSMVGYVKSGNLTVIIQDIIERVNKERIVRLMSKSSTIGIFDEHYLSTHNRLNNSNFDIQHLFFNFPID